MKTTVKSFLAVAAFTLALAACSQKTETSNEAAAPDTTVVEPAPVEAPADTTQTTAPVDTTAQ